MPINPGKYFIQRATVIKISLIILMLLGGCTKFCNELTVNKKNSDGTGNTYSLPLEKAYLFEDNGNLKVLLAFYKKNSMFKTDTAESLHVYINGDQKEFNSNQIPNGVKAFFIRVQMRSVYGDLKINDLRLTYNEKEKINISGTLASDTVLPRKDSNPSFNLTFSNIPIIKVKSFNNIYNVDNDYFKEIIRDNIFGKWH